MAVRHASADWWARSARSVSTRTSRSDASMTPRTPAKARASFTPRVRRRAMWGRMPCVSARAGRSPIRRSPEWTDGLRPARRPRADPPDGARLRRGRGGARRRGAGSHQVVPLRDRAPARRPRVDGHSVPGGVRRGGRRLAGLRDRRGGAGPRGLLGGHHHVRAHVAGHAADLPVRLRGAEAGVAAPAHLRRDPRRVRADRAGGRLGRRQRPHARPPGGRRVGDRRRQAVHHQLGHRHLRRRGHHRPHRGGRDLEPPRPERHAGLHAGRAVPQDGLERLGHAPAELRRVPGARGERARPAGQRLPAVPAHPRHRAHRRGGDGRRARPGRARPGAGLREGAQGVRQADLEVPGHPGQAGGHGDGDRGGAAAHLQGRAPEGSRAQLHAHRRPGQAQDGAPCRALRGGGRADPRRLRLHRGVPGVPLLPGRQDPHHRRRHGRGAADGDRPRTGRVRVAGLFILLLAAYAATLNVPATAGSDYAGAEPHHLLAAESIVSDRDVDLADEYRDRAYAAWYPRELRTDGREVGGRLVGPHGVGFGVRIAPADGLGGPRAGEAEMAVLLALAFALAALLARRMVPEPWASAGVAACGLSPPALAASTAITPGVAAAPVLAGAALCALAVRERPRRRYVVIGAALLALLPWLGWSYVVPGLPIAYALVTWALRENRRLAAIAAGEALSASLVFYVTLNDRFYGGLTPRSAGATDLPDVPFGYVDRIPRLAALWLDRDAGLLRWAPVLALVGFAAWLLYRSRRDQLARVVPARREAEACARLLLAVVAAEVAVTALAGATPLHGTAFPGVALAAVLPPAAALTAWALRHVPRAVAAA